MEYLKNKKIRLILIMILVIIILVIIYNIINNSKNNIDLDNNTTTDTDDDTISKYDYYNINFDNLENATIEGDKKINNSSLVAESHIFKIEYDEQIYSIETSNMEIYGDKEADTSYVSFYIENTSGRKIPSICFVLNFYRDSEYKSFTNIDVVVDGMEAGEKIKITTNTIDDIANSYDYKIK